MVGVFAILGIGLVVGLLAFGVKHGQRWKAALRHISDVFDLQYVEGGLFKTSKAVGVVDGNDVTVDSFTRSSGKSSSTYSRIRIGTTLPTDLRIKKEGFGSTLAKAFVGDDVEIGVTDFDSTVLIRGDDEAEVVSHFGEETRAAIDAMIASGAELSGGELAYTQGGYMTNAQALEAQVGIMLEAARRLAPGKETTAQRLRRHSLEDSNRFFRLRCIELLLTHFPKSDDAREVAREALGDPDPHIRLLAAESLRTEEAHTVIVGLLQDTNVPATVRAQAARALATAFGARPGSVPALQAQLDADPPDVLVDDLLLSLLKLDAVPPVAAVIRYASEPFGAVAREVAARCLGAAPDPENAEAQLLPMLDDEKAEVRAAAARALGAVGTRSAVEPLMDHAKGVFRNPQAKSAAREAIEEIQSRLSGAGAGQLSMSDTRVPGGELSVTPVVAGELSEVESS